MDGVGSERKGGKRKDDQILKHQKFNFSPSTSPYSTTRYAAYGGGRAIKTS